MDKFGKRELNGIPSALGQPVRFDGGLSRAEIKFI